MKVNTCILFIGILLCIVNTNGIAQDLQLVLPIGHTAAVNSVAISPDGKKVLTASADNTAKLWDLQSGALLADLKEHTAKVNAALFSPDGKKIITYADDKTAKIWDAASGKLVADLKGHTAAVYYARFSPDGKKLLTISYDHTGKIWDAQTGAFLNNIDIESFEAIVPEWTTDQKKMAFISHVTNIMIYDAFAGKLLTEIKGEGILNAICFSPAGGNIITANEDKTAKIIDAATGGVVLVLNGHSGQVESAVFSPDRKKIVTTSLDKTVKIWDAQTGKLLTSLNGKTENVKKAVFSFDSRKIITCSEYYETAKIWDAQTGNLIIDLKTQTPNENSLIFSEDGKKMVTTSTEDGSIKVWDVSAAKLQARLQSYSLPVNTAAFSKDNNTLVTGSDDHTGKIWDLRSNSLIAELKGHDNTVNSAVFSPNGKTLLTASFDRSFSFMYAENISNNHVAKLWDSKTGTLLYNLGGSNNSYLHSACYSPGGDEIVTTGSDGTAKVWSVSTGKILLTIEGYGYDGFKSAAFSLDGKKIIAIGKSDKRSMWDAQTGMKLAEDGQAIDETRRDTTSFEDKTVSISNGNKVTVTDIKTGQLVYSFFSMDTADYLVQIPGGYYMCTPNAAHLLHYVTKDLQVIAFSQLDIKYNRPDKVLAAIGCKDTNLIRSYRLAYLKRIKKLGIDTNTLQDKYSFPQTDIVNKNSIEYEQKGGMLSLHIVGTDSKYSLDRYNVWVNGSPVYGLKGMSVRQDRKNRIDKTISINLSQGKNIIEASVTTINGIESYHKPMVVNYDPAVPVEKKFYFIGIGANKYNDSNYDLKWSVKDIRDLACSLKNMYGKNINIDTIFDNQVTVPDILALKKHLLQTTVNDRVIIAYSGHGLLSKDYNYYMATYNINFNKPEENGLPYDELENLLDGIPARKKLLLIDACNSGEVDKEELAKMKIKESNLVAVKGTRIFVTDSNKRMGMKNSFEFMQNLFVNVNKNTGATVIAAAAGNQYALEKNELKNGLFTYSILEYMKQNEHTNVNELKHYVNQRVAELSNGLQVPTAREENLDDNWKVW